MFQKSSVPKIRTNAPTPSIAVVFPVPRIPSPVPCRRPHNRYNNYTAARSVLANRPRRFFCYVPDGAHNLCMMSKFAGRRANESTRPIVYAGSDSTPGSLSLPILKRRCYSPPYPDRPTMPTTTNSTRKRKTSSAVQSPLETYLREINETALLSAADERELATKIGNGDTAARDRMVRANLRLVVNIARGYSGKGLGLQDLIEEGNLGLLRAVEGFDPAMGTRFSTYASYWIKQSIKRALINSGKTIRIPAYMVELLSKWRRANARLTEELGRSPTPEEIARVLGLPKKKLPIIKKAIKIYNATPQTDQSEAGWTLSDMVMDERQLSPEDALVESDSLHHVMGMLQTMDAREATVLKMRFGLDNHEPKTLKEIGEQLGLTRERVRQIETEALNRMADSMEDGGPDEEDLD